MSKLAGAGANRKIIYLLLAAAVFLRFGYVFFMGNKPPVNDAAGYDNIAWTLSQSGEFSDSSGRPTLRRTPVYPAFIAAIYSATGRSYLAVRVAQALVGVLTCFLIFILGRRLFSEKVGLIAAVIALYYPFFIYYTAELLLETVFVFLTALSLYLLTVIQRDYRAKNIIAAGLVLGITALCKPVFLPYAASAIGICLLFWGVSRISNYLRAALLFIFFAIPLLLWGARNKSVFGEFTITHSGAGRELLGSNYSYDIKVRGQAFRDMIATTDDPVWADGRALPESERDKYYFRQGLHFIRNNPGKFMRASVLKFIKFWRLYPDIQYIEGSPSRKKLIVLASLLSYGIILPLSLLGFYHSLSEWRKYIFSYGLVIFFTLIHMVFWAQVRYRLPLMPVMIIFAAATVQKYLGFNSRRQSMAGGKAGA